MCRGPVLSALVNRVSLRLFMPLSIRSTGARVGGILQDHSLGKNTLLHHFSHFSVDQVVGGIVQAPCLGGERESEGVQVKPTEDQPPTTTGFVE